MHLTWYGNSMKNLEGAEALSFAKKSTTFVLDVRTMPEFQQGALEKASLIPVQNLYSRLSELPLKKDVPILVYCAHGVRSLSACQILEQAGYTAIHNLVGGICSLKDFK